MQVSQDQVWLQQIANAYGNRIAQEIGVKYDDYQPPYVTETGRIVGNYMQFTDIHDTKTTFGARSLEEARANLIIKRALFRGQGAN